MLGTDRLRSTALFEKIVTPEQAAALIEDGMNVGIGGFTPSGGKSHKKRQKMPH